ncbi:hypothetical protein EJ03DRAFT_168544 [Teratosphaeria nubilosa]|uniref:GH16 domain-containing protein n=1 Tax=Teratosphaeria nubilosa TaxID=161662 RepID=A0A6G1L1K0_9PEZI|nr:hypothetical protein EJ03DRAFT_168544 [Teratosphaeria nubilosa]
MLGLGNLVVLCSALSGLTWAQDATIDNSTSSSNTSSSLIPADCHCGFGDPNTTLVYTDSIIVYFNETQSVPENIFTRDQFEHPYEKGWSLYYREGAKAENVWWENGSVWNFSPGWLNLNVSGYTHEHLVQGAQLQSIRQDILYGTFRVFMRSPLPWAGGSALTFKLQYNETSSAELDLLNMDDSTNDACMQTSTSNQDPVTSWGLNYTVMEQKNIGPWDFWEWRMDWNRENISWYVGDWNTRTVPTTNASLVDVPTAFFLKHWSDGDASFMQGPPSSDSAASIGWVRLFFNSSTTTWSQADSASCNASMLCSTEDESLRLTTDHNAKSTVRWEPDKRHSNGKPRTAGIALMAASAAFGAALVVHALVQTWSSKRKSGKGSTRPKVFSSPMPSTYDIDQGRSWTSQAQYELETLKIRDNSTALDNVHGDTRPAYLMHGRSDSERPLTYRNSTAASSMTAVTTSPMTSGQMTSGLMTPGQSTLNLLDSRRTIYVDPAKGADMVISPSEQSNRTCGTSAILEDSSNADLLKKATTTVVDQFEPEGSVAAANPGAKPTQVAALPQQRTRVDYLAGLVAVCSLLVSCEHFILTYVPSVVEEYLPYHYRSEYWARRTIEPFFFNEIWVGLFFTTSTRFLTSGYLRSGNLKVIAEKVVCRCPRLMIPITAVIMFQYFLIDVGATRYLEYIPSISWATWPSVSLYPNFGWFVDATLQMFYLIPNAAPQVIYYYCTGVLWTIPVQLQNSWLVLLGAVVIREIKTPWKRFCYYGFCIINHWYALSWGSYFWFGLMLADLDITYKYRKHIQARWWVHYPMLTLATILVLLSLSNDLISIWTGWTFSTQERGIHPDAETGLTLAKVDPGYPDYTEPKLNGLLFAVCSQYIVELSPWVQAVLSTKVFLWLFPHVFTIYLIHGCVWWTIGSLVCVYFAGQGLAYWLNVLLTAIICYCTLFAVLPIITPIMEMLGKEVTNSIWVSASEEPAPWQPSSYPFSIDDIRDMVYRKDDDTSNAQNNRPARLEQDQRRGDNVDRGSAET